MRCKRQTFNVSRDDVNRVRPVLSRLAPLRGGAKARRTGHGDTWLSAGSATDRRDRTASQRLRRACKRDRKRDAV